MQLEIPSFDFLAVECQNILVYLFLQWHFISLALQLDFTMLTFAQSVWPWNYFFHQENSGTVILFAWFRLTEQIIRQLQTLCQSQEVEHVHANFGDRIMSTCWTLVSHSYCTIPFSWRRVVFCTWAPFLIIYQTFQHPWISGKQLQVGSILHPSCLPYGI